jgi:serine phosphatase RsbU (regulator of sigma subunit)
LWVDGIGCLLCFVLSYTFFMGFIGAEGTRHARVQAEIDLAGEIHRLLVPVIEQRRGRFEFFGVSVPSTEVGGDLVDVVQTTTGWVGYVADVSGHGVGAGLLMGILKSAMRTRVLAGGTLDRMLDDLNGVIIPLRKPNMFVTLAAVCDDGAGHLAFSVAGHPPILHYRAATGAIEQLTVPQVPLGMFDDRMFASARVSPDAGDLLAIVTDGLTEVFDAADQEFGMERLTTAIRENATLPLEQIGRTVMQQARAHGPQSDDQTLLLIRVGAAARPG